MSSRLFQEVREKRGLAYSIYSFLSAYRDTGMWGIYTAVAKETLTQTLEVIGQELRKLKKGELPTSELEAAKEFVKGGILLGAESSDNRMTRIAKNEMTFGRDLPFEEVLEDLNKVTGRRGGCSGRRNPSARSIFPGLPGTGRRRRSSPSGHCLMTNL